ncbi:MAG: DUF1292 domain-containing protein [Lachnospiraceae bacterium]|nr:DUF1292 domain-containing protein [Lachnospiraceae bacterium]
MEKIRFEALDGTVDEFYVEAETRLNGSSYLLVSDSEEDDASALILKDISSDTSEEAEYVIVEDDVELEALLNVFQEILEDDADIEL